MIAHTEPIDVQEYDNPPSLTMQDITEPEHGVDIQLTSKGPSGTVIHVNVDGICVLRICRIDELIVELDSRKTLLHLRDARPAQ